MDHKLVLVIEDDESIREVLAKSLADEGFDILQAHNGAEGLTMAMEHKPDLILLDLLMGVKDGTTTLRELRQDEWGKDAKVIVFTNYTADDEMFTTLAQYTPTYYFVKSDMSISEVIQKVQEVLSE